MACNKAHYLSKWELQNDLVKGKNNYPTTYDEVMIFLSRHNIKDRSVSGKCVKDSLTRRDREVVFTQVTKKKEEKEKNSRGKTVCQEFKSGTCMYKKPYT